MSTHSTEPDLCTQVSPLAENMPKLRSSNQSIERDTESQSKIRTPRAGISFNIAISPSVHSTSPTPSRTSALNKIHKPQVHDESEISHGSPMHFELKSGSPLPPFDQLSSLEIEDQIRYLALKEMQAVEIKDSISVLTSKLERTEKELRKLREIIKCSLNKEVNGNYRRNNEMIGTKNKLGVTTGDNLLNSTQGMRKALSRLTLNDVTQNANASIWTNLSKPLNLIQQLDSMILQEFEKSLYPSESQPTTDINQGLDSLEDTSKKRLTPTYKMKRRSSPIPINLTTSHCLKNRNTQANQKLSTIQKHSVKSIEPSAEDSDDMMYNVSNSIWAFVNDMKSNVLSSLVDEEIHGKKFAEGNNGQELCNLETGATINFNELEHTHKPNTILQTNKINGQKEH
ncbi:uncharacterized protein PRCAT00003654001 [Priceomyces carsonii]|uniref:uncharacterized protein n=1 Tax=Priceomyces carsonii TaxID=28549 RepID=UPI002ED84784|nr:unnamed protein product [Priceomyces carsonii]